MIACNTSTAVALADVRRRYPLPILGVIRPGAAAAALSTRVRRVGVIATSATVRSHAYFQAIKEENPAVEVYEHATPAFVPMVEAGELRRAGRRGDRRANRLAPLLGERDADAASSSSRCRRRPGSTRSSSAAPTTRCSGRSSGRVAGDGVAVVDSATATAAALVDLLAINGLETG